MRMWRKRNASSPAKVERSRGDELLAGRGVCSWPQTRAGVRPAPARPTAAAMEHLCPITDAALEHGLARRRAGGRAARRAARGSSAGIAIARGRPIARQPAVRRASRRPSSTSIREHLLDEQRVALGACARSCPRSSRRARPCAEEVLRRAARSRPRCSGSSMTRGRVLLAAGPARPDRRAAPAARGRRAGRRVASPVRRGTRCRSRNVGSRPVDVVEDERPRGRSRRAPRAGGGSPRRSPRPDAALSARPSAAATRSAISSRAVGHPASVRRHLRPGISSPVARPRRTISATGQKVMPSP